MFYRTKHLSTFTQQLAR
uniref:Uncharacterized protein n=1 Tax=Anguilla anguilla TaxID=7936 RepID=A0A0E9PUT1_ANGAN